MRINELLEGKYNDDLEFVKDNEDGKEIDFDLAEDIVFHMNNDDDVYRQHVYPSITKCLAMIKGKEKDNPSIFKNAAIESYKSYHKEYPLRELPDELDAKTLKEVCKKMYEEVLKHHSDGKYKD
jgi:hypothetical protein